MSDPGYEEHTHHPNYTKIYVVLLVLLAISVVGPMFEIRVVTLLTAFGIAIVKAYLVVKNFMHIDIAKRYVGYLVATSLVFMLLLWGSAWGFSGFFHLGVFGVVPFVFLIPLTALEIGIAVLQAYIFTILSCVYLHDALHLH